jgi:hypothetical protein
MNNEECEIISLITPRWTRIEQVPTERQIREWVSESRWDEIIESSNPGEYSRTVLPKARNALRRIAISLGERINDERAVEALSIMLSSFYWDIRDSAVTSLAKIGNSETLSFLESAVSWNWNSTSREHLKTSVAYLRARVSAESGVTVKEDFPVALVYALRAHQQRQYGLARFLLEGLITEIKDEHPSFLNVTVALSRSCAEMNDIDAAIRIVKPAIPRLARRGSRSTLTDVRNWLWAHIVFEDYSELRDCIYRWGLELDLSLALSGATADEVRGPAPTSRYNAMVGAAGD